MGQVEAESEMAMQQQTLMEHLGRQLRRPPFCSGRNPSMLLALVFKPQGLVTKQPGRPQLHCRFSQWKGNPFETREAAAERVPLSDVLAGFVDALLRCADAHQPDQRAAEIKSLHHLNKTGAFFADP